MWSVVTESPTMTRQRAPVMSLDGLRLAAHAVEVRRAADVRRRRHPTRRAGRRGCRARASARRPCRRPRTSARTSRGAAAEAITSCTSCGLGQMSARKTSSPSASGAERLVDEVEVHAAGERVRDDERRRGEVVRLHLGMDARLEVPVAGEHGARRRGRPRRSRARSRPAAAPSCRCRSCSRSRRCGSRAPRDAA